MSKRKPQRKAQFQQCCHCGEINPVAQMHCGGLLANGTDICQSCWRTQGEYPGHRDGRAK